MLTTLKRLLFIGAFVVILPRYSFASPAADGKLLPLVPPEVNIVAGVSDPHNATGHHLLVTIANSLELDDWLALTGVDNHRAVDQLMWLAATSPRGSLREHALLASGRFDRGHILRAARQNGAPITCYGGIDALIVQPFAREQRAMNDLRWLAILDEQTAVFGTPWLVQRAIDRYTAHASTDAQLLRRIAPLHANVNSWDVLVLPTDPAARHNAIAQLPSPWSELVDGADELTIGIRYGATTRIEFSIQPASDRMASVSQPADSLPPLIKTSRFPGAKTRVENLAIVSGRVEGSLVMPQKQFDACFRSRNSRPSPLLTAERK